MTEEQVFLAVLDLADSADRNVYLDKACGGDVEFRRRVEDLLAAHFKTGEFLDKPLGQQLGAGPATLSNDATAMYANRGGDAVAAAKKPNEEPDDLHFLQPSTRPDSLGRIGHYEVLQALGKGGFGIVFRAFDEVLQRVVALKVLAPAIAATSPARKRFLREARSSAQIRHENVVQVYAVEEQPLPYLVMEFIPGETLQQRLNRTGPLEVPEIVRIGRQIAEGLAAAHAGDLIHRDIKPSNVLLEGGHQRVKITDFGLARAADDASLTQSGVLAGTPMYMAPEQAQGETLDHRADLFSLGSVFYVMATGRPPFRASTTYAVLKRVVEDNPRPIREVIPEIPPWLCAIITKLHAKKPEDRFQSAREVADVLADCEAQLKADAKVKDFSRIPQSKPAAGRSGKWKWVAAAALLLSVLILAVTEITGVTHLLRGRESTPSAKVDDPKKDDAIKKADPPKKDTAPPTFTNSIGMEFVLVPKGKSWLGGGGGKQGNQEVDIPQDFYLGVYEVTQEEWEKVTGLTPSRFSRTGFFKEDVKDIPDADLKRFPVENVSWDDAQLFLARLNERDKQAGWVYRLPTETEWEYACRGGPMRDQLESAFTCYFDKPTAKMPVAEQVNAGSHLGRTCKVGSYPPNRLGLYDMHGNVSEWCADELPVDPKDPKAAPQRAVRGGAWDWGFDGIYAANRYNKALSYKAHSLGLRVARVPVGIGTESGAKEKGTDSIAKFTAGDKPLAKDLFPGRAITWTMFDDPVVAKKEPKANSPNWQRKIENGLSVTTFDFKNPGTSAPPVWFPVPTGDVALATRFRCENASVHLVFRNWPEGDALKKSLVFTLRVDGSWSVSRRTLKPNDKGGWKSDSNVTLATSAGPVPALENGTWITLAVRLSGQAIELWANGQQLARFTDPGPGPGAGEVRQTAAFDGLPGKVGAGRYEIAYIAVWELPAAPDPPAVAPFTDADVQRIAALPAAEQVEEVRRDLKKRNPDFDEVLRCVDGPAPKIVDGVVTEVSLCSDQVADISPLRALSGLKVIQCQGTTPNSGRLFDLSPLRGLNLKGVFVDSNPNLRDLTPLRGMPVIKLGITHTRVANIDIVKDMPISSLWMDSTPINDLSPLSGKSLALLSCGASGVKTLKNLPAAGVKTLMCAPGQIPEEADLTRLGVDNMMLFRVPADIEPRRLRALGARLKQINGKPAAEFWESVEKK